MDECQFCCHDITDIVYYQTINNYELKPLCYCYDCIQFLLNNLFYKYIEQIKKASCVESLKRLIDEGPPIYFKDTCIENNVTIIQFKYLDQTWSGEIKTPLTKLQLKDLTHQLKLLNLDDTTLLYNLLKEYNLL
jgi:hypothetical protein